MSLASTALVELTGLLSAYLIAARDEEDAAARLHKASRDLERAMADGREPALSLPYEHPSLVEARSNWWHAARLEARACRDWEEALNRYLRRGPENAVAIQLSKEWRFIPAEFHNGAWLQLRTFDRPDTDFSNRRAAVIWLHHQLTEHQPGMENLLSLWPTMDLPPKDTLSASA